MYTNEVAVYLEQVFSSSILKKTEENMVPFTSEKLKPRNIMKFIFDLTSTKCSEMSPCRRHTLRYLTEV